MSNKARRPGKPAPKPKHWGTPVNPTKLRALMAARGISATALAKKAGVSKTTVTNALRGGHLEPLTVIALSNALDRITASETAGQLLDLKVS